MHVLAGLGRTKWKEGIAVLWIGDHLPENWPQKKQLGVSIYNIVIIVILCKCAPAKNVSTLYPHLQLAWCCPWPIFCFEGYRTEPKGASGKTRQTYLSWNLDLHTRESGNKRIKPPIPSFQIPMSLFLFHSLQIGILYSVILWINNLVLFDIWMVLND
jgi:hypothetical protein